MSSPPPRGRSRSRSITPDRYRSPPPREYSRDRHYDDRSYSRDRYRGRSPSPRRDRYASPSPRRDRDRYVSPPPYRRDGRGRGSGGGGGGGGRGRSPSPSRDYYDRYDRYDRGYDRGRRYSPSPGPPRGRRYSPSPMRRRGGYSPPPGPGGPRGGGRPHLSCRIIIDNLTRNVTAGHVREIFRKYGEILELNFRRSVDHPDNPDVTACLILYRYPEDADDAVYYMDRGMIDRNEISVRIMKRRRHRGGRRRGGRGRGRGGPASAAAGEGAGGDDAERDAGAREARFRSRSRSMSRSRSPVMRNGGSDDGPERRRSMIMSPVRD